MLKRRIQLKDITGIAAGRTALINLPVGPRYHSVTLEVGDTGIAATTAPTLTGANNIDGEVRVLFGSAIQRRMKLTHLDNINQSMGGANVASYAMTGTAGNGSGRRFLTIYFHEYWRTQLLSNNVDLDALAWPTAWLGGSKFQVQYDIPAIAAGGLLGAPALSATAVIDDYVGDGNPPTIMKWFRDDFGSSGTTVSLSTLERRDAYAQISAFDTSDAKQVTQARLELGGVPIVEDMTADENSLFLREHGMVNQAGCYHMVFDHDDSLNDLLPTNVNSMFLKLTLSAASAGTISLISQRLGRPEATS